MHDIADIPLVIEVATGLFVRRAEDVMTWVDMGPYGVVIDTLEKPETEGEVLADIARTLGPKPIRYVLNTHTHYDHVALNGVFERRGATIINRKVHPLDEQGMTLCEGGRRLIMKPIPPCHTELDAIVHFPDDGVLIMGDVFGWGLIPLTTPLTRESAAMLLDFYRQMIALDPRVVVPGHGPMLERSHLERYVQYLPWLIEEVKAAMTLGLDEEAIYAAVAPPADMHDWWRFLKWKHADSVKKVIHAAKRGRV